MGQMVLQGIRNEAPPKKNLAVAPELPKELEPLHMLPDPGFALEMEIMAAMIEGEAAGTVLPCQAAGRGVLFQDDELPIQHLAGTQTRDSGADDDVHSIFTCANTAPSPVKKQATRTMLSTVKRGPEKKFATTSAERQS